MPRSEAHEARNAAVREGFRSVKDARAASVPTADAIVSTCETLKVAHKVEDVPDSQGARLHWIGDASPRNTILYFHGMVPLLGLLNTSHVSSLCLGVRTMNVPMRLASFYSLPVFSLEDPNSRKGSMMGENATNSKLLSTGGGLGLPAIPGHIIFLVQSQQKLAADGKPFSIAFLEYGKALAKLTWNVCASCLTRSQG